MTTALKKPDAVNPAMGSGLQSKIIGAGSLIWDVGRQHANDKSSHRKLCKARAWFGLQRLLVAADTSGGGMEQLRERLELR